jgi:hypothetical protein
MISIEVDKAASKTTIDVMATINPNTVPTDDLQAVLDHVISGTPLDPEVTRRVRERSSALRQELRKRHGILNVAVDLIREVRDEE